MKKIKIEISVIWVVLVIALILGDCAAAFVIKRMVETAVEYWLLLTAFGVMELSAFIVLIKNGVIDGLGD